MIFMLILEKIIASAAVDADRQNIADDTQNLFSKKKFMTSAYLFWEIFAMTGLLSRILQGVNIDFCKALNFLDAALEQLSKLRSDPQKIIHALEENFDGIKWEEKRISEGDGCQMSLPKVNLQPLQKRIGGMRYSTQLEYMNVFLVVDIF